MTISSARPTVRSPVHLLIRPVARVWFLSLAIGFIPLPNVQAQPETRIGYVEMKRLLDNAPQIGSGNTRLRTEFAERDRLLKQDEARLATLKAERSDDDDAAAVDNEIAALEGRIQRTRETLREELRRRSEQEIEQRFQQINETVAAYARENGYDLIVHSPVFYASPSIDITDRILELLRKQHADDDQ